MSTFNKTSYPAADQSALYWFNLNGTLSLLFFPVWNVLKLKFIKFVKKMEKN